MVLFAVCVVPKDCLLVPSISLVWHDYLIFIFPNTFSGSSPLSFSGQLPIVSH